MFHRAGPAVPLVAALFLLLSALPVAAVSLDPSRIGDVPENLGREIVRFPAGDGSGEVGLRLQPDGSLPWGLFNAPTAFRVEDGRITLLDALNRRLLIRHPSGRLECIPYPETIRATDFLQTEDGFLLADIVSRQLVRIDRRGREQGRFGGEGEAPGYFLQLDRIDFSASGEVLVLDWGLAGRVTRFTVGGELLGIARAGSTTISDLANRNFVIESNRTSGARTVYRASPNGVLEEPVWMEPGVPGGSFDVIGHDREGRIYLKSFQPPKMRILVIREPGKVEREILAHNRPEMDCSRLFSVDPADGGVYAIRYADKALIISRLD